MDDDQQFCLRWNNHQSTLVAVFDTLLENGTLVDCTLAAEGKYLNAHKVVLSACSPYFETLLSKHFDKHPIVVLKDVKFQELKAMMDYMYRGEVNISQDQLGALLKAAESLQIKGLSDNKRGETERKPVLPPKSPPTAAQPAPAAALPKVQGLTIEQRAGRDEGREGSASPGPRKKKRMRRKSEEMDNHHDASSSSESHSLPAAHTTVPALLPAISKMSADVPEPVETKSEILTRHKQPTLPDDHNSTPQTQQLPMLKEKIETHTELMLEPKAEYVEEMNEDSIEDLTLDDDDLSNMEQMDEQAGPSHGNAGEGSSQGFGGWHMGNQSQDEVFLAAQEAVGAHRDSQDYPMSDTDYECEPHIDEGGAKEADNTAVPTKSGIIYEAAYQRFIRWCNETNIENYTEEVMLAYFSDLETKSKMKSSTMWSQYSMIKSIMNAKHGLDISKYLELRAYLKQQNKGYTPKKSKVFTSRQFDSFLAEASDDQYLAMKVILIIGIFGACRCDEMVRMTIDDIEDFGTLLHVKIPDKSSKPRTFTVVGEEYVNIYRKYVSTRPDDMHDRRLFLKYTNGKSYRMVMGIHTISSVPRRVAAYLNLPDSEEYTGHCLRRTSATFL